MRTYYPVYLNLDKKNCVVIGGGEVALWKVKTLLGCGAKVTVISPRFHPEISRLAESGALQRIRRSYQNGDLKGSVVVISATNRKDVNRAIAGEAKKRGVLVNVVDDPELSDFIVPSFFRRGGLTIAVSTSGMSPGLARKIRTKLERDFGEEYASLLTLIEEVRSTVKAQEMDVSADTWQEALDLDLLLKLMRRGQREKARDILMGRLDGRDCS